MCQLVIVLFEGRLIPADLIRRREKENDGENTARNDEERIHHGPNRDKHAGASQLQDRVYKCRVGRHHEHQRDDIVHDAQEDVHQEEDKAFMIAGTNTVVNPVAVVIISRDAFITATAVMRPRRFGLLTHSAQVFLVVKSKALVIFPRADGARVTQGC